MEHFLFILVFLTYATAEPYSDGKPKCELISVPMCRDIGYNMTSMPNQFHHDKQDEAGMEVHQFWPLVEMGCSPDLRFFLCSMYTPICMEDYGERLLACRSVCERARSGCAEIMSKYGFQWPESMKCSNFPIEQPCMDKMEGSSSNVLHSDPTVIQDTSSKSDKTISSIQTTTMIITVTAFACALCSLMVIFTYFTDPTRFCYPERSIVFISASYLMVSLGFLFPRFFEDSTIPCDEPTLINSGLGTPSRNCITVFILIYFFSMAAALWWVVLTFSWLLSATLKWSTEAIDDLSRYFHLFAWGVPAIQSYIAKDAIDGEPLAGICLVGNRNSNQLAIFIIAPLCAYLVIESFFIIFGLISIGRISRKISKQIREDSKKFGLNKLLLRIIICSSAHILPTSVVIVCNYYQFQHGFIWETNYSCSYNPSRLQTHYVYIHFLKHVMFLIPGITTFLWILSWKTLKSWWYCLTRKFCCCWANAH